MCIISVKNWGAGLGQIHLSPEIGTSGAAAINPHCAPAFYCDNHVVYLFNMQIYD